MKLYSTPGTCALSPHIVLRELGVAFALEQVDLGKKALKKDGGDYWAVNAKGYVPALELDDGSVITEGAVIIQYLADRYPEKRLAPPNGTMERVRLQEWLNFIATELHKGQSPMYNPKANEEFKGALRERLNHRFGVLSKQLEGKAFLLGDNFSIADAYAFYVLRGWQRVAKTDLSETPTLKAYFARLSERPSIKAAVENESATLS
ncbi:MAG: glutathione transferase GstA [Myxococcota bacterium]